MAYTERFRRNLPYFAEMFLLLYYVDVTKVLVTEFERFTKKIARKILKNEIHYIFIVYQIHSALVMYLLINKYILNRE